MNVAEYVAEFFERHGMKHAFGIVGAGNVALFDAIARRGFTEIVCTHHEAAAAVAAINYWRISGVLAPVLVTTGAGSANAITGVLNAWMDRVPLLVISGNETSQALEGTCRVKGAQGYQTSGVANWITKWAIDYPALDSAFRCAMTPAFGPVWMDIPRDQWAKAA